MSEQQVKWASQHDWFVKAENGVITVWEEETKSAIEWVGTFRQLREWAGY